MKTTIGTKEAAIEYAQRGWAVMPLKSKKKDPHFDLIKNAYLGATTDEALIDFLCYSFHADKKTLFNDFNAHWKLKNIRNWHMFNADEKIKSNKESIVELKNLIYNKNSWF